MDLSSRVGASGRDTDSGDLLEHGARVGLVVYGVLHLIVAFLGVQLAFGDSSGSASQQGALSQLAQNPLGKVTMYAVALGLVALVLWQLAEAVSGHRRDDGAKRTLKRLASVGKAVVYGTLGFSAFRLAIGSGSSGSSTDTMTARLMSLPAGQVLVGLVGVGILVVAGTLAWIGYQEKFTKHLDSLARSGDRRTPIVVVGKVGYLGKGTALAIVGGLFGYAALTNDAQKSGGLDQALRKVLDAPFGPVLLVAIALGIGCFGLYCIIWARHLEQ